MPFGLEKKIAKIVMKIIDETIGKKFPIIDVFQEQDKRFKEIERDISAIKSVLKEKK